MYLLRNVDDNLDVNFVDNYGNSALHYAVWRRRDDKTLLHKACERSNVIEARKLVSRCFQLIDVQNNAGDTPLHIACRNGHSKTVETLMLAGANETITNDRRHTPLQLAKSRGYITLLRLLDRASLQELIARRSRLKKLRNSYLVMLTLLPTLRSRQTDEQEL